MDLSIKATRAIAYCASGAVIFPCHLVVRVTIQLPLLMVLLSQCHQFRALDLLGRFLDMGPWAVDLALSVGIFPYVLKLLQTTTPELRQILVFIWTKILALDKSCQVDLVKDGGHVYFISFLNSVEAYPEQRAMSVFVLAVIVDGHRRGQEACIKTGLIQVCLKHLHAFMLNEEQTEPLLLQWLCLCLGKLWEDFAEAQVIDGIGGDEECDDVEKNRAENIIIKSLLNVGSDGSPLVRAEVAVALAHFACGHKQHLKSFAAAYWKSQPNSRLNSLPFMANIKGPVSGNIVSSQIGPLTSIVRDGRVSTSSPLTTAGIMHGSPLSDDSSHQSDSEILNDCVSNGEVHNLRPKSLDNAMYSQCVLAMCALAKDPSPLPSLVIPPLPHQLFVLLHGWTLVELDVKITRFNLEMILAGHLPLTFRTPPVSPPRQNYLAGIRRVCSLDFRPLLMNSPDSGLADPLLGSVSGSERSLLPESTIYNFSCGHFSKPLLTASDESEELLTKREEQERFALEHIAKCQHSFKLLAGIQDLRQVLEQPCCNLSPIVIAADENERIRVWDCEEATLLNGFDNHDFPEREFLNCLWNELDDSFRWKYPSLERLYTEGEQKLVTAFSSIQGHKSGVRSLNAVLDWQQQSGYLYSSGEISSIMLWDLDNEQLVKPIPSASDCSVLALMSLQSLMHCGSILLNDWIEYACIHVSGNRILLKFMLVNLQLVLWMVLSDYMTSGHPSCWFAQLGRTLSKVERVVGIGFQPGLDQGKIVSASQAGDIQFLDIRNQRDAYLTIVAHRGSLTALDVHRHAPIIASGLAKQLIKVFSLEGKPLGTIQKQHTFMAQKIGSVSCLTFHPYQVLLAASASDTCVSIYADDNSHTKMIFDCLGKWEIQVNGCKRNIQVQISIWEYAAARFAIPLWMYIHSECYIEREVDAL
ncbi:Regulatory-associated protein of TOR 1 [Hibiscus syriacus]|uniref:Regulatory-associated protein of TOR 1 n=1 Tax=Hibiscus syriacus TaxID=106335 RepID=A0A6A3AEB9_HIBSY|nr:Regulatory-associated protein of TOR 1 [Hibiscus syriacus]